MYKMINFMQFVTSHVGIKITRIPDGTPCSFFLPVIIILFLFVKFLLHFLKDETKLRKEGTLSWNFKPINKIIRTG